MTAQPSTLTPRSSRLAKLSRSIRSGFAFIFTSQVATIGFIVVSFWFLVGFVSLFWTPYSPNESLFALNEELGIELAKQNALPDAQNWLGTDQLGRDILSRLMTGTQVILLKTRIPRDMPIIGGGFIPGGVAIWGVVGSLVFGSFLGVNAGYRSGWWDQIIMQFLDAMIAFPSIILYLVVISALGRGDLIVILAITITGAPGVARLVRSLTLDIKTRDYIRAAQTRGENAWYIMFIEILPNARGPILVDAMLCVGYAIFSIATLGFLGLGLPPPDPDWGNMVNDARQNIFSNQVAVLWPALAIASLVIGLNLLADGIREELTRYQK